MTKSLDAESVTAAAQSDEMLGRIGRRIRAARTERGLTQKALGALAGVHDVHISRLDSGTLDTRISTLRKVAVALGVSVADLVGP